jgi:DNA-binding transcriptional LysR family regulator
MVMKIETNDWADLPFFLALSRAGSLRAASDMLRATHATVNRRITQLEAFYGVRLFERSVEGLSLTAAGEELLPMAIKAEEAILRGRRKLSGLDQKPIGRVRISTPPGLTEGILAPILASFTQKHPDIDLEIVVTNAFQDLTRHEIDVSVRIAHSVSDDVVGRKLLQYASGIYATRDYVEKYAPTAGPQGEGLTWLGWGDRETLPDWVRKSPFPKATLRHTIREATMQIAMVRAGVGMSTLPILCRIFIPNSS